MPLPYSVQKVDGEMGRLNGWMEKWSMHGSMDGLVVGSLARAIAARGLWPFLFDG